ncbi:hypothetical protein LRF89_12035 [Halorhodospira sp. 9621]|uniref:hypothetical protein n=1 Tax=Halorhodospira sp. 9621 TaxID=2899135 RepID=UPI001EE89413|nr:hypothetical protein [Halorhodospira sp. 9621]MCG5534164.1 hypothetical protein [Halorhodospira sp. 9621]
MLPDAISRRRRTSLNDETDAMQTCPSNTDPASTHQASANDFARHANGFAKSFGFAANTFANGAANRPSREVGSWSFAAEKRSLFARLTRAVRAGQLGLLTPHSSHLLAEQDEAAHAHRSLSVEVA